MTIKEFAYSAQQHLKAQTGNNFKRSHIYELLAASFGYDSFAALCVGSVIIQEQQEVKVASQHNQSIRQRCIELGYQSTEADTVSSEWPTLIEKSQIAVVSLSDLVKNLRDDLWDLDRYSDWDEDEQFSPELLVGLEVLASKDNALAHYALALIHRPNDEYNHEAGIDYWYNQEKQGRVLTGVEKEWADDYAKKIVNDEKYEFHLREAARLGDEHALLDLAERFGNPSFFDKVKNIENHDPLRAADIAEELGREEDVRHWLTIAAEAGDIDSMRRLIEEFDKDDLQRCWTWLYLAQLLETDLTQDNYHAINEDGSDYDDDVGGPMYPIDQDGIKLDPLNKSRDTVARKAAQDLFEKISEGE
jgi:hypothetical protein